LLGCELVFGGLRARIVETEAYAGQDDLGSHGCRGKTPRNAMMFGEPGHAYVYFTYGNHWMLNVTARPIGECGAVLIRGAMPLEGLETMRERRPKAKNDFDLLSGPGKLAAAFGLDREFNGLNLLSENSPLLLVPGEPVTHILVGTRIGIAKGRGDETPWRFVDEGLVRWASKPHP